MAEIFWAVSYPRSGSMFLRALVAGLQFPDWDCRYTTVDEFVPDFHHTTLEALRARQGKVLVKSHHLLKPFYDKVIYLYRDGRDVLISYFHYCQHRDGREYAFEDFFTKFLAGGEVLLFGTWENHVDIWTAPKINAETLFVRYEDLHAQPADQLRRVAGFMGLPYTDDSLAAAIEKARFGKMCKSALNDSVPPAFRGLTGKPGGWREMFSPAQAQTFWDTAGHLLARLGYPEE